jgi:hypothetical protein
MGTRIPVDALTDFNFVGEPVPKDGKDSIVLAVGHG